MPEPVDLSDQAGERRPAIYTKAGDDGSTGLLYGGRVAKNHPAPTAYGDVDEAQAVIGVARAALGTERGERLDGILTGVARDLWVLMAELATAPENSDKLVDGATRVTAAMVHDIEVVIDEIAAEFVPPAEFVVPGSDLVAAHLDVARTVVRRAERNALAVSTGGSVGPYLNRLSDLLWTLARWREGTSLPVRDV